VSRFNYLEDRGHRTEPDTLFLPQSICGVYPRQCLHYRDRYRPGYFWQ
jgi:hypothetical protein